MWLIILLYLKVLIISSEDINCYFNVLYLNGSRSWCLDEECSINDFDIILLENVHNCQTNYLSLRFSSYLTYKQFLNSMLSHNRDLSSFFSLGRPNVERLLQIEFLFPLENGEIFEYNHLSLLSNSISNIDTYELIFTGNLIENNKQLFFNKNFFLTDEQRFIDTLRLIFNCTKNQRIEWELIKSIQSFPNSPCPQQIQYLNYQINHFHIIILTSGIFFGCFILILIIILILFYYLNNNHQLKQQSMSDSQIHLTSTIQRF